MPKQNATCTLQNTAGTCQDGDIRLSDGEAAYKGRVEVCFNGVWGTIVSGYYIWLHLESMVMCRQLGYKFEGMSIISAWIGDQTFFSIYRTTTTLLSSLHSIWTWKWKDMAVFCTVFWRREKTARL